jgi:hypothetical protein
VNLLSKTNQPPIACKSPVKDQSTSHWMWIFLSKTNPPSTGWEPSCQWPIRPRLRVNKKNSPAQTKWGQWTCAQQQRFCWDLLNNFFLRTTTTSNKCKF